MNTDLFLNKNTDVFLGNVVRLMAILSVVIALSFFIFVPLSNDDVTYFKEQSFSLNWLINERYMTWSGRVLLESVLPFLCKHDYVFRVVSVAFVLLNVYSLKLIFKDLSLSLILLFLSLFPFYNFESAGLVATTVNYYYPAVLGIFSVGVLLEDERASLFIAIALVICSIIASNHEQMSLILVIFSSLLVIKNKHKSLAFVVLFLSILGLLNCALCPGNHLRLVAETAKWMPEFSDYSFFNKVYLGISSTLYFLNFSEPFFLVLLTAILFFLYKKKLWMVMAILVIIYLILRLPVRMNMKAAGVLLDGTFIYDFPLVSLLLLLSFDFLILFLIVKAGFNYKVKTVLICLFALANMLRASVGFSPTVFASLSRPSIFSEIIIVVSCMIIFENRRSVCNKQNLNKLISLLCCFSLYSNIRTLLTI